MSDTKVRVHSLAKELGVTSKAILDKCSAEGMSIANHMTVLSAGQEETIREWFSEGPHTTAVEESERVDLKKVRRPRRAKKESPSEAVDASVATLPEPPVSDAPVETAAPEVESEPAAPTVVPEAEPELPEAEPPPSTAIETPQPAAPEAPLELRPAAAAPPAAEPPPPPREAMPAAGPQNVPRPAQLQGPRVVRMDRPDVLPAPRPAARSTFGGAGGRGQPPPPPSTTPGRRRGPGTAAEEEEERARAKRGVGAGPASRTRANPRRSTRDNLAEIGEKLKEWRDRDLLERRERLAQVTGRQHRVIETTRREQGGAARPAARPARIQLVEPIVLKDFCRETGVGFDQLMPKLMAQGVVAGLNRTITADTAQLLALEFGLEVDIVRAKTALDRLREERDSLERKSLQPRPPIVTILGHVDHGKTSLLDRIRAANVAASEAGGITQHIGAYRVKVGDRHVTFLDTPGHAAFTAMRARGANMTDVVVLVVAADDGVMPQTIEAVNHARAAKVPIVVALNKMDLPGVDINKLYGQLSEHGLTPQEWGGETDVIKTSAVSGDGVPELLEHLAALSELLDLKADATVPASGTVIEAQMKEGIGCAARVMVREGTLKNGAFLVCGPAFGRVRAMRDENGRMMNSAGPATPVELAGLNELPSAGDEFFAVGSLQEAKNAAEEMQRQRREASLAQSTKTTDLASLLASAGAEDTPQLNVILKADVQGSVDVLRKTLSDIPSDEVRLTILHAGAGAVSDGDVALAAASRAIIIAFNVVAEPTTERLAQDQGVEIRSYRVIYDIDNDIRAALAGLLAPTEKLESRGRAEVREVFNITRVGRVAGCLVRDGVIQRNNKVRVLRDSVPIQEGLGLASLKRFKDDVREVRSGLECGLRIEGFDDLKPGDVIEAYEVTHVARQL